MRVLRNGKGYLCRLDDGPQVNRHRPSVEVMFRSVVESAGANLMEYQVELWADAGKLFRNLARLSAQGLPTVVVLHGPSTAGGAYMPGMSDYVIGVKNNGLAALGGAALVKAATGEVADERELGGTEMHAAVTGSVFPVDGGMTATL